MMTMGWDFYVGLDLGQASDYTAITVAEEPVWIGTPPAFDRTALYPRDLQGWVSLARLLPHQVQHFRREMYGSRRSPSKPPLYLRHLERIRHRPYPAIADEVQALLDRPLLAGANVCLLVDYTGVGRAVVDFLRHRGLGLVAITITGGNEVHGSADYELTVPKRELITATQIALQGGRLRIAAGLEHAPTLTKELLDYRVLISQSGHDSYQAREGQHDDLVLATSLVCWYRDWYWQSYDNRMQQGASA